MQFQGELFVILINSKKLSRNVMKDLEEDIVEEMVLKSRLACDISGRS